MSEHTVKIKKESLWMYSIIILVILVIGFAYFYFNGQGPSGETNSTLAEIPISAQDPQIGNANAKVTVVEFSDFSCPFCAAASGDNEQMVTYMKQRSQGWEPIVTNMMKDYVDTGKVRFVAKYYYGHTGGHPAQLVAWCLNDQNSNLYWEFYPLAYANFNDVENLTKMKELASGISGVDTTQLNTCLSSNKFDSRFEQEQNEGVQAGVQGTPAFFVNGELVSGAVPYSQFKKVVDAALTSN